MGEDTVTKYENLKTGYYDETGSFVEIKGDFSGDKNFDNCFDRNEICVNFEFPNLCEFEGKLAIPKYIRKKYHSPKRQHRELFKLFRRAISDSLKQAKITYGEK